MNRSFIFFLVWLSTFSAICQTQLTREYLDERCRPVASREEAFYYRVVEIVPEGYLVKDHFISNDQLEMQALCSSTQPKLIMDGEVKWYYENGQISGEGYYIDNQKTGLFKHYYEDGSPREEVFYEPEKIYHRQHWSKEGIPLLVKGTGNYSEPGKEFISYYEIEDSVLVGSYSVSYVTSDTVYGVTQERADYRGGLQSFYKSVQTSMTYPKLARRQGIEGKVFIEFLVDKSGSLLDVNVIKGIGGGCDEVALEAVKKQGNWIPARHRGKPVRTRMVLPIAFRLGK